MTHPFARLARGLFARRLAPALLLALFLVAGAPAFAMEIGCKVHPSKIDEVATRVIKSHYSTDRSVENVLPIQTNAAIELWRGPEPLYDVTYEAIIRPEKDEIFALPVFPLLGVEMNREQDAMYLCAHSDSDPAKTHVTIYFLHGYGLEPNSPTRFIRGIFKAKKLNVAPLPLVVLGVSQLAKVIDFIFGWIPGLGELINLPVQVLTQARRIFDLTLDAFVGTGVERIVIKTDGLEVATGVDLEHPEHTRVSRFIKFEKDFEKDADKKDNDGKASYRFGYENEGDYDFDP